GAAVAIDHQRHFHAGPTQRPDLAEESCKVLDLLAGYFQYHVAGAQIGFTRGAAAGYPRDHHFVVDLSGVETEPRPRRMVRTTQREKILKDRFEKIDRHNHVQRLGRPAFAYLLHLQRPHAPELARPSDHPSAAPERMRPPP